MTGPKFVIVDDLVNVRNRSAVAEFARLAGASTERKLKPAEVKRFARLQTQLMKTGVVVLLTKALVTARVREFYNALPWWRKLLLRVRYRLRAVRTRIDLMRLRLRS